MRVGPVPARRLSLAAAFTRRRVQLLDERSREPGGDHRAVEPVGEPCRLGVDQPAGGGIDPVEQADDHRAVGSLTPGADDPARHQHRVPGVADGVEQLRHHPGVEVPVALLPAHDGGIEAGQQRRPLPVDRLGGLGVVGRQPAGRAFVEDDPDGTDCRQCLGDRLLGETGPPPEVGHRPRPEPPQPPSHQIRLRFGGVAGTEQLRRPEVGGGVSVQARHPGPQRPGANDRGVGGEEEEHPGGHGDLGRPSAGPHGHLAVELGDPGGELPRRGGAVGAQVVEDQLGGGGDPGSWGPR